MTTVLVKAVEVEMLVSVAVLLTTTVMVGVARERHSQALVIWAHSYCWRFSGAEGQSVGVGRMGVGVDDGSMEEDSVVLVSAEEDSSAVLEGATDDSSMVLEDAVEVNSTELGVIVEDDSIVIEVAATDDPTMLERVE